MRVYLITYIVGYDYLKEEDITKTLEIKDQATLADAIVLLQKQDYLICSVEYINKEL